MKAGPQEMSDSCCRCRLVHSDKVLTSQCRLLWALERPMSLRHKRLEREMKEHLGKLKVLDSFGAGNKDTEENNNSTEYMETKTNKSGGTQNYNIDCDEALGIYLESLSAEDVSDKLKKQVEFTKIEVSDQIQVAELPIVKVEEKDNIEEVKNIAETKEDLNFEGNACVVAKIINFK